MLMGVTFVDPVWEALRDPIRRAILDALMLGPRSAGDLAGLFPQISRPAVSQHLAVLREAGLVHEHRDGRYRVYTLDPEPLEKLWQGWLERYHRLWLSRLQTLKEVAEHDSLPVPTGNVAPTKLDTHGRTDDYDDSRSD